MQTAKGLTSSSPGLAASAILGREWFAANRNAVALLFDWRRNDATALRLDSHFRF